MVHADDRPPGDDAGERHHARPGRADRVTWLGAEVDAPVAGQPRLGRRQERASDRW
jgi:hypothetical protein